MNTPLPPTFNIVSALSGCHARRPSNAPAAALWLYNPSIPRISLDHREEMILQLVNYFYRISPPADVALWKAEAAGLPPSAALALLASHFDDPI